MDDHSHHLIAIGKVAANFAVVEMLTGHLCMALLDTDAPAAEIVATNLSYSKLLDVVGALTILRIPEGKARKEVSTWLDLARDASTKRNRVLHSTFAAPDEEGEPRAESLRRVHRRSSPKKGLVSSLTDEGTREIETVAQEIYQVIDQNS